MKFTDTSNEDAIDMLADILEPASEIFTDPELKKAFESGESQLKVIKMALKTHKQAVIEIMAILDGVPVEEYHCNVLTLPIQLLSLLNDKDLAPFFQSSEQKVI